MPKTWLAKKKRKKDTLYRSKVGGKPIKPSKRLRKQRKQLWGSQSRKAKKNAEWLWNPSTRTR